MLYLIADALGFPGILNLFRYITFRAGGAVATALFIGLLIGPRFIGWLRLRQGKGQPIREDGPASHLLTKKGTPTMGGLMILTSLSIAMLLWMRLDSVFTWACMFVTLGFGAIGFADDYDKVTKRHHAGMSGRVRLLGEFIIAGISVWVITRHTGTFLYLPFTTRYYGIELGWFYPFFAAFVIVGAGNAVNLTDGLDGLATMPVIIAAMTFLAITYVVANVKFATYLGVPHVAGAGDLSVMCAAIVGAGLAFLWFNAPPAAVFMGDTGSLALGGALGAIAVTTHHELVLAIVGGLFVLEAVSVIIQVFFYKRTGKRVFRMAPIHHHFEQLGWSEPTIVIRFWIISFVLALAGLATLKLKMITSPAFAGRRYVVLGLARSGLATVAALVASGAEVLAWDNREEARALLPAGVEAGDPLGRALTGFDAVVVSPGVPLNRHPIADHARKAGVPVLGDIELFAQARAALPPHRVVGITGTNGKSTTTALIHHILVTAGLPAMLGGNIGLPILGQDPLPAGGVYVLELSSYQIDLTMSLDCDVAVLLNITPDHLDRYDGFAGYVASKARLFQMQSAGGVAVIATEDDETRAIASRVTTGLREVSRRQVGDQVAWPTLQGPHNAQNIAAAIAVADALGISPEAIEQGLRTYPGLPHRMERVRTRGGVLYVNDSKATNPASTAPALAAYDHIHWILGGQAKTDELDACLPNLGHVRAAYTIGEAGPMFAQLLRGRVPVTESSILTRAVHDAADAARPGDTVLLSPACASFDQFTDYEARGAAFRAAVEAL